MEGVTIVIKHDQTHWLNLDDLYHGMLSSSIVARENRHILKKGVAKGTVNVFLNDHHPIIAEINYLVPADNDNAIVFQGFLPYQAVKNSSSNLSKISHDPVLVLSLEGHQACLQLLQEEKLKAIEKQKALQILQQQDAQKRLEEKILHQQEVLRRIEKDDDQRHLARGLRSLEFDLTKARKELDKLIKVDRFDWPRKKSWRQNKKIYAKEKEIQVLISRVRAQRSDVIMNRT